MHMVLVQFHLLTSKSGLIGNRMEKCLQLWTILAKERFVIFHDEKKMKNDQKFRVVLPLISHCSFKIALRRDSLLPALLLII